MPNIRIHIPNGKAINRWHCDSDSDPRHPFGEINCVLPLTNMFGTNSFWRESEPNKGDFKPFHLKFGRLLIGMVIHVFMVIKINSTQKQNKLRF